MQKDISPAIEKNMAQEEKREAWRQEGIAAYEHYMRTGLHLTSDEVCAWIDQICQGKKVPMPRCHV